MFSPHTPDMPNVRSCPRQHLAIIHKLGEETLRLTGGSSGNGRIHPMRLGWTSGPGRTTKNKQSFFHDVAVRPLALVRFCVSLRSPVFRAVPPSRHHWPELHSRPGVSVEQREQGYVTPSAVEVHQLFHYSVRRETKSIKQNK